MRVDHVQLLTEPLASRPHKEKWALKLFRSQRFTTGCGLLLTIVYIFAFSHTHGAFSWRGTPASGSAKLRVLSASSLEPPWLIRARPSRLSARCTLIHHQDAESLSSPGKSHHHIAAAQLGWDNNHCHICAKILITCCLQNTDAKINSGWFWPQFVFLLLFFAAAAAVALFQRCCLCYWYISGPSDPSCLMMSPQSPCVSFSTINDEPLHLIDVKQAQIYFYHLNPAIKCSSCLHIIELLKPIGSYRKPCALGRHNKW